MLYRKPWLLPSLRVIPRTVRSQCNKTAYSKSIATATASRSKSLAAQLDNGGSGPFDVSNFIDGNKKHSVASEWIDINNPATQALVCRVPRSTHAEMEAAVSSAQKAFQTWRDVPVQHRSRVMFKFQALVRERTEELAASITMEQGKTLAGEVRKSLTDARGDVFRGLEVVEQACGVGASMMGETLGGVAKGMDTYSYREPLGVCAGICPFNFPAMIPLWMFPLAVAAGNTFVMKPSEKCPGAAMLLASMAKEAGLPDGVLNVIHGGREAVDFICDAPEIKAISFVGGNQAGEHIFSRGTAKGKRVQSNMGAKNHAVVMPDANRKAAVSAIIGASFGAAGQRCMALSVAVFVGAAERFVEDIVRSARQLKVGPGWEEGVDVGPMVTPEAKERAELLIESSQEEGVEVLLDGRGLTVPGYEQGNFLGPTVLGGDIGPGIPAYDEEVFGPVLCCITVETLEDAIEIVNACEFGNGTSIFTQSGAAARKYQREINAGQVGINVPTPVPLPFFSFTGSGSSFRGDINFYGKQGIQFYTRFKTVTSSWSYEQQLPAGVNTSMPTHG